MPCECLLTVPSLRPGNPPRPMAWRAAPKPHLRPHRSVRGALRVRLDPPSTPAGCAVHRPRRVPSSVRTPVRDIGPEDARQTVEAGVERAAAYEGCRKER